MPRPGYESEKMSLEDYLLLIQSGSTLHLTVAHLNQIITMHGFKKLHRVHKNIMSEAVNTLDLMEPSRSTLQDYISPPAFTDVVAADMDALGWTECHVTKVVTLSSFHKNDAVECSRNNNNRVPLSLEQSLAKAPPKKLVLRRKRRAGATSQMSGDDEDYVPAKKWKSLNSVSR